MTTNAKKQAYVKEENFEMFQKILVPIDYSSKSIKSYKTALNIAKKYDSNLTILNCFQVDASFHLFFESKPSSEILKKQKKSAKAQFQKLQDLADKNKILIKSEFLISKSVIKDIIGYAKSHKIDLIVMGSHGRTGFDKLVLGSVANGVVQKCPCPVLIVK